MTYKADCQTWATALGRCAVLWRNTWRIRWPRSSCEGTSSRGTRWTCIRLVNNSRSRWLQPEQGEPEKTGVHQEVCRVVQKHAEARGAVIERSTPNRRLAFSCGFAAASAWPIALT